MKNYHIAIQCSSLGQRCGVFTYTQRLAKYLENINKDKDDNKVNVKVSKFISRPPKDCDIINIQYEPGLMPPRPTRDDRLSFMELIQNIENHAPAAQIAVTVHHIGYLPKLYQTLDGFIFHSHDQTGGGKEPWYPPAIIPHPALVFEEKDKDELREKFNLPKDKKILCTAGFIAGTGKELPKTVEEILKKLNDDEFLYLATAFWKGGDLGNKEKILKKVRKLGKEHQFRIDTNFVDDKTLYEKMQASDLLWTWCAIGPNDRGSQSGIAADMYGTRRKLIVKDSAHYSFIGEQDKAEIGRPKPQEFAEDVINVLRNKDLDDVQDPEWLSWEEKAKDYLEYFKEIMGE